MYKISIILPVFNVEKYVERAFNSILNQTIGFENLEVIFVDDCSTDNSAEIIQNFVNAHENVKYYCLSENSGAAGKPRNVGMKYAQADYLMFLDPDDVFTQDACEVLYTEITNGQLDVVSGNFVKIVDGEPIKNKWGILKLENGKIKFDSFREKAEIIKYPASVWSKIFKKSIILENDIQFPENVPGQDLYFLTHCLIKANGILYYDHPVAKYMPRVDTNESMISKKDKKTLAGFIKVYKALSSLLEEYDESLKWLAANNLNFWSKLFVFSDLDNVDKIDLLYYASPLYDEVKESPKLSFKKGYEAFYEKICEKDFYGAIEEANKISLKESGDIIDMIKSRNIFMIFIGCELQIGGLAKAVFNRANLLSDNGYENITLLNIDTFRNDDIFEDFRNFKFIESFYKEVGYLNESITIINMFDYFSEMNTINPNEKFVSPEFSDMTKNLDANIDLLNPKLKTRDQFFINGEYVIEREVTKDHQVNLHYYDKFSLKNNINSLYNLDKLIFIKDFSVSQETTPIKSETYINHSLVVKTLYEDKKVNFYTPDGFNYCSIQKENKEMLFELTNRSMSCSYTMNYKEFYEYFILLKCSQSLEKPFLINDCPGRRPSIANISSDLAYKISSIHCNHHKKPYNLGSEIQPLGAFENIEDLDALVLLTNSQKNDFKQEFEFDKVYNIPNFMPNNILENTYWDKSNANLNKISVFSRIDSGKNIIDVIEAFKKVVDVKPDAVLEIFGRSLRAHEVREHNRLIKLINEYGLQDKVIFRGHVLNVYEEIVDSLITVSTSKTEGLSLVLLESMANSTPVVSYNMNYGPKDVIANNKDGFLVEEGDVSDLSEKMLTLLNNPSKAIEMGQLARKKIFDKFSEKPTLSKWETLFKDVFIKDKHNLIEYSNKNLLSNFEEEQSHLPKTSVNEELLLKNTYLVEKNNQLNLNLKMLEKKYMKLSNLDSNQI